VERQQDQIISQWRHGKDLKRKEVPYCMFMTEIVIKKTIPDK
jgi:hypothetical protein